MIGEAISWHGWPNFDSGSYPEGSLLDVFSKEVLAFR